MSTALSRLPAEVVSQARFAGGDGASAVAGEGMPAWLAPVIGATGALVAAAAAWMWVDARVERPVRQINPGGPPAVSQGTAGAVEAPPNTWGSATSASTRTSTGDRAGHDATAVPADRSPIVACPGRVAVAFAFDSAIPDAPLPAELVPLIAVAGQHAEARILVQGYADPVGADHYNLLLSWRRARSVAAILERLGVPAARMSVAVAGVDSRTPVEAAGHRRVDVLAVGVPGCTMGR